MNRLTLDVPGGTSIHDAAKRAQQLADETGCEVVFDFNGVECSALQGGKAETLVDLQMEEQARKPRVNSRGGVA